MNKTRAYTDDELRASASKYQTLGTWKRGPDAKGYRAAWYQKRWYGREDFWTSITAHMVAAGNPYNGAYFVYACIFPSTRVAYVGLSCRGKTVRLEEHKRTGPVARYMQESKESFTFTVLQSDLPDPRVAKDQEARWHAQYVGMHYQMLNQARTGSLGTIALKLTKADILQRALDFSTRKAFAVADRSAYGIAKKMGWFEEAVAHMEDPASVRSQARTGEKRTNAAKAKMRAAKLGTVLPEGHKSAIAASTKASWDDPEIRARRTAGMAQVEMGRPSGWVITAEEARYLGKGLSAGRANLTEMEKKVLRRYRYNRDKVGSTSAREKAQP